MRRDDSNVSLRKKNTQKNSKSWERFSIYLLNSIATSVNLGRIGSAI